MSNGNGSACFPATLISRKQSVNQDYFLNLYDLHWVIICERHPIQHFEIGELYLTNENVTARHRPGGLRAASLWGGGCSRCVLVIVMFVRSLRIPRRAARIAMTDWYIQCLSNNACVSRAGLTQARCISHERCNPDNIASSHIYQLSASVSNFPLASEQELSNISERILNTSYSFE